MVKCPLSFEFLKPLILGLAFLGISFMLKVPITFQVTYLILIGIGVGLGYATSSGWVYVLTVLFSMLLNLISFDYSLFGSAFWTALALFFGGWIYLAFYGFMGAGGGQLISAYQEKTECKLGSREGIPVGEKVA